MILFPPIGVSNLVPISRMEEVDEEVVSNTICRGVPSH